MQRDESLESRQFQPPLITRRLILRPFEEADALRVEELASDRELADTTQLPHPYPPGAAAAWIATHAIRWSAGELASYAVTRRGNGELIGAVSLLLRPEHASAELGYWIGRAYWGNGFATEAASALLAFGFDQLGLNRVSAPYMVRNAASGSVLEKLGMSLEGVARQAYRKWGVFEDIATRAILRAEWEARRGQDSEASALG
jgi:[ribosomal protein S5]-alanine N-acetyltransferase